MRGVSFPASMRLDLRALCSCCARFPVDNLDFDGLALRKASEARVVRLGFPDAVDFLDALLDLGVDRSDGRNRIAELNQVLLPHLVYVQVGLLRWLATHAVEGLAGPAGLHGQGARQLPRGLENTVHP